MTARQLKIALNAFHGGSGNLGYTQYQYDVKMADGSFCILAYDYSLPYADKALRSRLPDFQTSYILLLVILLVGIGMLLISLLCIRFITALGVEKDKREAGMLKALGVANKDIRFLYFSKYILLSVVGAVVGLAGAGILIRPSQPN